MKFRLKASQESRIMLKEYRFLLLPKALVKIPNSLLLLSLSVVRALTMYFDIDVLGMRELLT